jgi:hypothetical protein
MSSSGILLRVTFVRTYVSEELIAFIIVMKRISEIGIILAVTNN